MRLSLFAAVLIGCGTSTLGDLTQSDETNTDPGEWSPGDSQTDPNATSNETGSNPTGTDPSNADCDNVDYEEGISQAVLDVRNVDQPLFIYQAFNAPTTQPFDVLEMQSYQAEPYNGPSAPGMYDLTGANYEDCGLCLLIWGDCDDVECSTVYFASEGEVEVVTINEAGQPFEAILHDVVFTEVSIDADTWKSTAVAGGKTWCLDDHTLFADYEVVR